MGKQSTSRKTNTPSTNCLTVLFRLGAPTMAGHTGNRSTALSVGCIMRSLTACVVSSAIHETANLESLYTSEAPNPERESWLARESLGPACNHNDKSDDHENHDNHPNHSNNGKNNNGQINKRQSAHLNT